MLKSEFTDLVLEHQARLRVFIRMLGASPDAVDDLAQDAFVVAYDRLETLRDRGEAGPWLRAIARNLVRNELRKSSRRRRIVNAQLTEAMLLESTEREEAPWEDDWLTALRRCREQLPGHGRQLIDGRYAEGRDASQLATDTGKTATAVRQSLTRLRKVLRDCIEARLAVEGS